MTVMTLSHTVFNPHRCEILVLEINLHDTFLSALSREVEPFIIKAKEVSKCAAALRRTACQGTPVSGFAPGVIFILCVIPSLKFPGGGALGARSASSHHRAVAFLGVDVVPVVSKLLQVQVGRPPVHLYKIALLR